MNTSPNTPLPTSAKAPFLLIPITAAVFLVSWWMHRQRWNETLEVDAEV